MTVDTEGYITTRRRLPRYSEFRSLIGLRQPSMNLANRRLSSALTVSDLARLAQRRTPRSVFDYVSGGAEEEISLRRAREAYGRVEFEPRVLRDVSAVELSRDVLGERIGLPVILAPTGFTRMMHHHGELAVALAAQRFSIPYALSTMGTTSPEGLADAAPELNRWFQLYLWRDRDASHELVARARNVGFRTLVLTVDTPVAGNRFRDVRNGLTIPPRLSARTLTNMASCPSWWFNLLTTEPLAFACLSSFDGTVAELVNQMFDPSLSFMDLKWLREVWPDALVVKGIQSIDDARRVVDEGGADAIVVSNHGGRQLDRAPTPLELLPAVVDAVGDRAEVYIDTGISTGSDVVAAVGLGATACMIGRPYLYGLMAGGQRGVERVLEILTSEARRTLQLMGAADMMDVRGRVRLRS